MKNFTKCIQLSKDDLEIALIACVYYDNYKITRELVERNISIDVSSKQVTNLKIELLSDIFYINTDIIKTIIDYF